MPLPMTSRARRALFFFRCLPFALIAASPAGHADAQPSQEFNVTAAQMQALGVTLQKLQSSAQIRGMLYPARVVVPSDREQVISAPVAGVIDQLFVTSQQSVAVGQPVVRLASPRYGELQLAVIEAANKVKLSSATLKRERQLAREGIIPERRVMEAEVAAQADLARLRQAEAALKLTGTDADAVRRIAAGGPLQDALTVRSRTEGTVLELDVKPGQRVQESDPLVRLVRLGEFLLDVQLPADRAAQQLPPGSEIEVVGRDLTAVPVSFSAIVSDNQTFVMRARVKGGTDQLRPGEVVQVRVPFANNGGGWALPLQSIARQDGQAYVFVRTERGFAATPVTVAASAGQSVQVFGQLKAGQEIAVTSVITLKAAWQGKGGGN
ncbi:MAG: efflux RND transporter periplasmic adaptor subunit [Lautropia sp.]